MVILLGKALTYQTVYIAITSRQEYIKKHSKSLSGFGVTAVVGQEYDQQVPKVAALSADPTLEEGKGLVILIVDDPVQEYAHPNQITPLAQL